MGLLFINIWNKCRGGGWVGPIPKTMFEIFFNFMTILVKACLIPPFGRVRLFLKGGCQKKNPFFLGDLSQMWVGGVADSQKRSKPLKAPQNHLESCPFRPEFHLSFSQISQKSWGGWVGKQIWERSPKKKLFFYAFTFNTQLYNYWLDHP